MKLSFLGAAGTVTGSKFLLESAGSKILVDCGMFQGLKELRLLNWERFPIEVKEIDAVLLTHAHLDHSGLVPRLVKYGLRAPVYCSTPTGDLLDILWRDAARIQEEDADYANRRSFSKHHPARPLFDEEDAMRALRHVKRIPFGRPTGIGGVHATLFHAGHILGSSFVEITCREDSTDHRIVFSGDLGRTSMPLHSDPEPLPACDTLVIESTYGDRLHPSDDLGEALRRAVEPTLAEGGTVLIPAFAVARAQVLTLLLQQLQNRGDLPRVPIDIDSPMAVDATEIYRHHLGTRELDELGPGGLLGSRTHLRRSGQASLALSELSGPRIIISASGMLTGGRVLHHIRRLGGDPKNAIVLTGFQADGTRGRRLLNGERVLRIHGQDIPIAAKVVSLDGFSAHADAQGLMDWIATAPVPPRTIFIVHGEPSASAGLAERLHARKLNAIVPALGQRFEFVPESGTWRRARSLRRTGVPKPPALPDAP